MAISRRDVLRISAVAGAAAALDACASVKAPTRTESLYLPFFLPDSHISMTAKLRVPQVPDGPGIFHRKHQEGVAAQRRLARLTPVFAAAARTVPGLPPALLAVLSFTLTDLGAPTASPKASPIMGIDPAFLNREQRLSGHFAPLDTPAAEVDATAYLISRLDQKDRSNPYAAAAAIVPEPTENSALQLGADLWAKFLLLRLGTLTKYPVGPAPDFGI